MSTSKQRIELVQPSDLEPSITIEKVLGWLQDVNDQYQREEDQAVLQLRMDKATMALAGKEACQRLKNDIAMRYDMERNILRMNAGRRGR